MAVNAEPTTVDYFIQLLRNKVQSSKPQLKATAKNQNKRQPYHKSKQLWIWRSSKQQESSKQQWTQTSMGLKSSTHHTKWGNIFPTKRGTVQGGKRRKPKLHTAIPEDIATKKKIKWPIMEWESSRRQTPRARCREPKIKKGENPEWYRNSAKRKAKGDTHTINTSIQNSRLSHWIIFDVTASSLYFSEKLTPP